MLKLAVPLVLSVIVHGLLSDANDTCVNGPFCTSSCDVRGMPLECPLKCNLCSSSQMTSEEKTAIERRKPTYTCDNGWSIIPGNQITQWGAMKSMTGLIDFANVDGKTMYIYGYGYDASAYVYFEPKDESGNTSFYMDLNPYSQIRVSNRTGGAWNNYAVIPIVLHCCSPGFYPRAHYFWMIELTFGTKEGRHFIDITNRISGEVVFRFYLGKAVQKDDRYYFTQAGYNVLGVAWSNPGYRTFESGLPVGSEIQLVGKILKGHVTITLTKKDGYTSAIIMFRRPERGYTEVEVTMQGTFATGGCFDDCHYADFYDYTLTIITIRRISGGFEVIAVFVNDLGNVVVRCWDTTKIKMSPFSFSEDIISFYLSQDHHLSELAAGFSVDVVLYGEHADNARNKVKAGDIVMMRNLHFYFKSGERLIVMHDGAEGNGFTRGIDVLPNCDMKTMLLREIEKHRQRPTTGISDLARPPDTVQYAPNESRSRMFTAMMIASKLKNIVMNGENIFFCKNKDATGCLVKETLEVFLIQLCLLQILERDKSNILPPIIEKCEEYLDANHTRMVKAILSDSVLKLTHLVHSSLPHCGRKVKQEITRQENILPGPVFPSSVVFDRLWYMHFFRCLPGHEFKLTRAELPPLTPHASPLLAAECPKCRYWGKVRPESLKNYPLCFRCFKQDMSIVNMEQRLYIQLMSKEIDGNQFRFLFPYDLLEFFGVCLPYNENECLKMCDDRPTTENLRLLWSAVENRFAQLKIVISVLKLRASDRKSCIFEIKELIVCLRPQEKDS